MKSMSNNNWLGFSLSPHMSMEVPAEPHHHPNQQAHHHHPNHQAHHHHHQAQAASDAVSSALPACGFFLPPSRLNNSGICYGVEGENGGFYSQLPMMPLKSDGSLCIMEAFSRSQQQQEGMVPSPSPKLEDFLGSGPNMGTHQYGNNDRGARAMALSLDSMYYNQNPEHENSTRGHPLDLLHPPLRQQLHVQHLQPYFHPLHEGMCSGLASHELYQPPLEGEPMADDELPSLKSWVARHYSDEGGMSAMGYGDLQPLSLSMSPGSQSSCVTAPHQIPPAATTECMALDATKKRAAGKGGQKQPVHRKSIDTFGQRTSQYRGVTRHRWTGRYEAHLWDNSCKKEGQTRKGRQVYLGGYDMEEKAARAYDLAALKYWGPSTHINFPVESYHEELEEMKNMGRQEYVAHLRRKSSGFSRGASIYRGVTRHHQHGRWQARIGRVAGNKDLYLGTFSTQEEAAEAYDIAAIKFRGANAVTNFDITRYDVEKIMASNTLLAGEVARKNKAIQGGYDGSATQNNGRELDLTAENRSSGSNWKMALYQSPQQTVPTSGSLDEKTMAVDDSNRSAFLVAPLHGFDMMNSAHGVEGLGKLGSNYFSNTSSLVTSLSCSREESPDRSLAVLYSKQAASKFMTSTPISSLIPSSPLGPATQMAHMPVFAAWSDT